MPVTCAKLARRTVVALVLAACLLAGCGGAGATGGSEGADGSGAAGGSGGSGGASAVGGSGGSGGDDVGTTSGPAFAVPDVVSVASFHDDAAQQGKGCAIDVSAAAQGYVAAKAESESRLKLQVVKGDMSYSYDLPGTGEVVVVPVNMGDGGYIVRVMQNTSGNNYVELFGVETQVNLESEQAPFLLPNQFVSYDDASPVVAKARELAAGAANQGDVVRSVYQWVVGNITYDYDKAAQLSGGTGYIPSPDDTLASGTGVCFDYASLGAAMLRSLGIPCKVVTGYVSPDEVYHAWNMVYIDGEWVSVQIRIKPNVWTRVDLTFAANGANSSIGDGAGYADLYTY